MSEVFKRENRYLVLKREDVFEYLTPHYRGLLGEIADAITSGRKSVGKKNHDFVCVADDWPEYEIVWALIEARMTGKLNLIEQQTEQIKEISDLRDRLKMEAQIHAQEARTANATLAEIYQLCSGATGEPGSWHGAEPVRQKLAAANALIEQARAKFKAIDDILLSLHKRKGTETCASDLKEIELVASDGTAAIERHQKGEK